MQAPGTAWEPTGEAGSRPERLPLLLPLLLLLLFLCFHVLHDIISYAQLQPARHPLILLCSAS